MIYAAEQGVTLTVADTIDELDKIKELAPKMRVLWRIVTDSVYTNESCAFHHKFGD